MGIKLLRNLSHDEQVWRTICGFKYLLEIDSNDAFALKGRDAI